MQDAERLAPAIVSLMLGEALPPVNSAVVEAALRYEVAELLLHRAEMEGVQLPHGARFQLTALAMRMERRRADAEAAVATVADIAEPAGCAFAVFKGAANAVRLYDDVSERGFGDVDIVVGLNDTHGLNELLTQLGRHPASAEALVSLARRGQAVHEISLDFAGIEVDLHFNPFGMITPLRAPALVAEELNQTITLGGRAIPAPSAELSLLISSVNLVRKGGGALWIVADCVRLAQGKAGPLDWERFGYLAESEGLRPLSEQALRLVRDLGCEDVPEHVAAPRTAWWGPEAGEGAVATGISRRGTLSVLHQRPADVGQSLRSLYQWYLPNKERRTARSPKGSGTATEQLERATDALSHLLKRRRS